MCVYMPARIPGAVVGRSQPHQTFRARQAAERGCDSLALSLVLSHASAGVAEVSGAEACVAAQNSASEDARIHTHTQRERKNAKHVRDSEKETQVQDDQKAAEDDDICRKDKTGERRR